MPREILASDRVKLATVQRRIPGFGEFVEVSSPILDGIAGSVHVGMDKGLIALKIQTAIGRQVYLISIIFIVGIVGSFLLVNLAAKPLGRLGGYADRTWRRRTRRRRSRPRKCRPCSNATTKWASSRGWSATCPRGSARTGAAE